MQAIWYDDYDSRTDKIYKRPCCPECRVPIGKLPSGEYRCYSCGEIVTVKDKEMKDWFKVREETKTELDDCHVFTHPDGWSRGCGGKNCVEIYYRRNNATLEWEAVGGECKKCGLRWFV